MFGIVNPFGASPEPALAAGTLPCDIYASYSTPCVTAHSTVRALFSSYSGPLYQIQRASDKNYLDIGLLAAGGYANAAPQVSFCSGTTCKITKIYDQTTNHNDMPISSGGYWKGPGPNGADVGADAMALPVTVAGHQVYGVKVTPGVGYRIDNAKGVPTGSQPEGLYMITSSNYVDSYCCFDYGSGENSHTDTGNATMNSIYWGTACWFGGCVGNGPWVEADLENGMYHTNTGSNKDPNNSGVHYPFVSAWEKNNGTSNFTLKYGNAQSGGLTTPYSGALPNSYSPMKVDSSILLGTGGDNSVSGQGEFFEGAVTSGYPSDTAENAVQASIVAAGYGSSTQPTPSPSPTPASGYAVNAGGATAGTFAADAYYNGGSTYSTTSSI
ncbi:arabinofuranosidase catalytic domain-containing protein, partial [Dictyobacter arantiisoli]|uniref:arabinofuranosidase catalytic domain-containing protein n=1 Tax=Dictyobacter arantiisoli TaxID=2014874 RepID=UPI0011ED90F7